MLGFVAGIHGVIFNILGTRAATDKEAIHNKNKGLTLSIIGGAISFALYIAIIVAVVVESL